MLPQANASSIVRDNRRTYGYNQQNVDQTMEDNLVEEANQANQAMNNTQPTSPPEPSPPEVKPAITKKVGRGMSFAPTDRDRPQAIDAQVGTILGADTYQWCCFSRFINQFLPLTTPIFP